ncbi:hypothetical protein Tco_1215966 [Tanacetum coccineum]
MVVEGEVLNDFPRFIGVLIAEFADGGVVNLALKIKGDMIIKKLDLKPTIDAVMRDFLEIYIAEFTVLPDGKNKQENQHVLSLFSPSRFKWSYTFRKSLRFCWFGFSDPKVVRMSYYFAPPGWVSDPKRVPCCSLRVSSMSIPVALVARLK